MTSIETGLDVPAPLAREGAAALGTARTRREVLFVGTLFLVSGAAGLLYEVLWLKQLGLLFGNTAQAAAATLAVFFLGLSAGARAWGGRAARAANPLRVFAALEIAVAGSALAYFALYDLYLAIYRPLAAQLHDLPVLFTFAKLALATAILLPPAFFMGGTLPFMTQHMVRRRSELGHTFSWLYACNTVGGAAGAFAAAFLLAPRLGLTRSYAVAMGLSITVASLAWWASRAGATELPGESATAGGGRARPAALLSAVAFFSGAATLGLEVLWTRMFAQVLHNSVYSFATILVSLLVALALGAAAANRLCRPALAPDRVLPALLIVAGCAAGVSPFAFYWFTSGLSYLAPAAGWWGYVGAVFGSAAAVLLVPGICAGLVFPYLLHMAGDDEAGSPGGTVGALMGWNTFGSIVGSLFCGFVLIEWLGLWAAIRAVAGAYLALAVFLVPAGAARLRGALAVAIVAVLIAFDPTRLPLVTRGHANEIVRETWETGDAIVAVTEVGKQRLIKVDNYYSLGGTTSLAYEEAQADIPLVLHPAPRRVFFLGLGTGITAGAALRHAVEEVTVCELIPDVVSAARRHFAPYTNGLFADPRARVLSEDGRQHLLTTTERYDVIIADLFIPWQAGTGSLYTRESFALARARLRAGGLFAQWLPLYQLSQRDFLVIARTMLEVFPQVTLWRGDFTPDHPIVALIGQEAGARLDADAVTANFRQRRGTPELSRSLATAFAGLFYAGNLSANRALFADAAINTDDLPVVEYLAPVAQREQAHGERPWFTSFPLARFEAQLLSRVPPRSDPYLARLAPEEREHALSGMDLFSAVLQRSAGNAAEADYHADSFRRHVPAEVYAAFRKDVEGKKNPPSTNEKEKEG